MNDVVSIGILTFNQERFIRDTIMSVLRQSCDGIELIILDDCSCDQTYERIMELETEIKNRCYNYKIIRHRSNSGNISSNVNEIIKNATGKYYFGMGGDDLLLSDGIRNLKSVLVDNPMCSVAYGDVGIINESFKLSDEYDACSSVVMPGFEEGGIEGRNLFYRLMHDNYIPGPSVMRNMNVFRKYGYHREDLKYEDYEYLLRLAERESFYYLPKMIGLYRRTDSSITNYSFDGERKMHVSIDNMIKTLEIYIDRFCLEEQKEIWSHSFNRYMDLCREYDYRICQEFLLFEGKKRNVVFKEVCRSQSDISNKLVIIKSQKQSDILDRLADARDVLYKRCTDYSLNCRTVAIYGYGKIGISFRMELNRIGIEPEFIIDKMGKMVRCNLPIYRINDIPKVDVIVVTLLDGIDEVRTYIRQKYADIEVIELKELIY